MEPHEITISAVAASIFIISWIITSAYLFYVNKRDNGSAKDKAYVFSWTFHVESLRFYGFLNMVLILVVCGIITETSGFETIPDKKDTVVFQLFGINYACNWIDHNPSKMIAAILMVPLVQVPLMLYAVFWHYRLAKDVQKGRAPEWLLTTSQVLTPFNLIAMSQLHMWYVNDPQDTYGFVAHYIPYLLCQISVCLFKLLNLCYLTEKGQLPWGVPKWLGWSYIVVFVALTLVSILVNNTTIAGVPIIDATRNPIEKSMLLANSYTLFALTCFGTLILSGKERLNGDTMTFTIGDNAMSLDTASQDDETNVSDVIRTSTPKGEEEPERYLMEQDV